MGECTLVYSILCLEGEREGGKEGGREGGREREEDKNNYS